MEDDMNLVEEFHKLPKKLTGSQYNRQDQLYNAILFVGRAVMKNHNVSVAVFHFVFDFFLL